MESAKFRVADEILGLEEVTWDERYEQIFKNYVENAHQLTPRPVPPFLKPPSAPFISLAQKTFSHPAYGTPKPCLVSSTVNFTTPSGSYAHPHCQSILASHPVQRILSASDLSIPTYIIPWIRSFSTHLRLAHFNENFFNVTVIWSNAEVREREGHGVNGDVLGGLDDHFEVEWVHGTDGKEEGLALKGGFWGKEGLDSRSPEGFGKDSAEVWFEKE